jgi:hypothetical protein
VTGKKMYLEKVRRAVTPRAPGRRQRKRQRQRQLADVCMERQGPRGRLFVAPVGAANSWRARMFSCLLACSLARKLPYVTMLAHPCARAHMHSRTYGGHARSCALPCARWARRASATRYL